MKYCVNCQTNLPDEAKYCFHCGVPQPVGARNQVLFALDLEGDLRQQIVDFFFKAFKQRVDEEHQPEQYKDYIELLYETGFRDTIHARASQMAQEITAKGLSERKASKMLDESFEGLLDYFFIHFGRELNMFLLPDAILKYEGLTRHQIDGLQMVMDYLDFGIEQETIYTDFFRMPARKIKNASRNFLFATPKERIYFISDQSLLGSCKEGFAMTEKALYWKMPFQQAAKAEYDKLQELTREKSWIVINDNFFNVNPSLNIKMLKLLKKLKRLSYS
jgi:hypothetical protein